MANIGDGLNSPAIEQDPSIAQLQAQNQGVRTALEVGLPESGFVASINALSGLLTIQAGTSSPGVTVTISGDAVSTITIGVTGIGKAATAPSNITAGAPTPSNDESEGWQVFSLWLDTTVPKFYACASNATMTAVWVPLG